MAKLVLGAVAAAIAMFITGFIFFATPLGQMAYGSATEAQQAAVQNSLAANLSRTATYMVPAPDTPGTTVMYGKGPVAMVHYNSAGFSVASPDALITGFVLDFVVALLIGLALYGVAARVVLFADRVRLLVLFSVAALGIGLISDAIWSHVDWAYTLYAFVGSLAMLVVGGLVIIRWFLPAASGNQP